MKHITSLKNVFEKIRFEHLYGSWRQFGNTVPRKSTLESLHKWMTVALLSDVPPDNPERSPSVGPEVLSAGMCRQVSYKGMGGSGRTSDCC